MDLKFSTRGRNAGEAFWGCTRFPSCRGSRDIDDLASEPPRRREARKPRKKQSAPPSESGIERPRLRPLKAGDLLESSANDLGPGKLVATEGDMVVLEFFDSPGLAVSKRYREAVPKTSVRRFRLSHEHRVFWVDTNDHWRSGRILETSKHNDIYVRGHEWEGFVPEELLYVRWNRPLGDPVGFAEAGLLESPMLAELRLPFLQRILQQRSAAHGMRAVLSSCVELHAHQVETAWRVLQDPVQRYLLADEVGLGKTIEAGIIIRQLLLDDPGLRVQFVLPPFLVEQWRRELTQKFRVQDFPDANLAFSRDDEPSTWRQADLLVVDEAHNLTRLAVSRDRALRGRFETLRKIALESPRLLLLSATPALHNEDAFLAMLKLLDPALHADTTAIQLRSRLESRASLGRVFLGLQPGLPGVLLKARLTEIEAAFPDDPDVKDLVSRTRDSLAGEDRKQTTTLIQALRSHVSEVYRVNRRMLRTRRTTALEGTYRVAGRRRPEAIRLESNTRSDVADELDRWREQALAATEGDRCAMTDAARSFADATSVGLDPSAFQEWARRRSAASVGKEEFASLERIEQTMLYLNRRTSVSRPFAEQLSDLMTSKERAVVFCPTADLAVEVAEELVDFVGSSVVFRHVTTQTSTENDDAVRSFEMCRRAGILIADSSAEEGRNLQFADVLVHLGLPTSANRLEQRIGRCDRWSPQGAGTWRSYVASEDASFSFAGAWEHILRDGFGIFDSSVASLQHAVDSATDEAWRILLQMGLAGIDSAVAKVREMLASEVERVREQDALDSLEANTVERSVYSRVAEVEAQAPDFAKVSDDLLAAHNVAGNLRFDRKGDPRSGLGSYEVLRRNPGRQTEIPLIPASRLVRDFSPLQGHVGTYMREVALKRPDVHLYRYGDAFVDAVSDFLWHDDRGRAFGMWRWIRRWKHEDTPVYRFDYAVEANPLEVTSPSDPRGRLTKASSRFDSRALARRADGIFPPIIVSIWMTDDGRELTETTHLDALSAPYRKPSPECDSGDYALNRKRITEAYEIIPESSWGESWRTADHRARKIISERDDVHTAVQQASEIARRDAETRISQLRLRTDRATGSELVRLEEELQREELIARAMSAAVAAPSLRLDGTGIVILSGRSLGL
ncbi:hypothetical protein G6031_04305 [Dietzia sp. CQ4]|nr:protein DpdE [Dietzia sp. CQ4]MBB1033611.1 hypothetical protein [Dietzia sp. CQ4]